MFFLDCLTLEDGTEWFSWNVCSYKPKLRKIPEEIRGKLEYTESVGQKPFGRLEQVWLACIVEMAVGTDQKDGDDSLMMNW